MSAPRSCAACAYSEAVQLPQSIIPARVCRRFPPVAIAVTTPQGLGMTAQFPVVPDELWCHEYRPAVTD